METDRDDGDLVFSLSELFVRSFVTECTSHPDALGPDVRCELEAVPKFPDLAEGERKRDE